MKTIVAPLYIRPVKVTEETGFLHTGADKHIEHRNIMAWKSAKFDMTLSYFLDDEISLDDAAIFYRLVEEIGYGPFIEIAPLDAFDEIALRFEQPDRIPSFIVDSLFRAVRPRLEEFRPQLKELYGRMEKIDVKRNRKELEELILECWRQARSYGFAHHFTRDRDGFLVHIVEGREIRAGVLIGLAQHLEKRGNFPQPPSVRYCRLCGGPIMPLIYRGRLYCSDACRRQAANSPRSRLVNLIQTKSRRMMKRGELTKKKRDAMLRGIREEKTIKGIKQIARRYGVDPAPARAGRKAKDG